MIDAAGGNPFYLTSLLSHLRQTGERFTIPASINLLVDQRLARLAETAALVLQTCVLRESTRRWSGLRRRWTFRNTSYSALSSSWRRRS